MPTRAGGVVCILARAPSVRGKTRLTAGLSAARAVGLRRALLLDTLASVASAGLPVVVCYTPASAHDEVESLIRDAASSEPSYGRPRLEPTYGGPRMEPAYGGPRLPCPERSRREPRPKPSHQAPRAEPTVRFVPQPEGDLGLRMRAAFTDVFALGFDRVLLIGSDLPTLPPEHLVDAMAALDRVPLVIGPADDGGYYLIGMRESRPALFDGVPWGTPHVLTQTLASARGIGVDVETIRAWRDVDVPEDLEHVPASTRARHTRAWLTATEP